MANVQGTNGNDERVKGTKGDDIINGLGGNDRLEGGQGRDTYVFGRNFGNDVVGDDDDSNGTNPGDKIIFQDDSLSDVVSFRTTGSSSGANLIIETKNGTVNIKDFQTRKHKIETINFKDGTVNWNGEGYDFKGTGVETANLIKLIVKGLETIGRITYTTAGAKWVWDRVKDIPDHGPSDHYGPGSSPGAHNPGSGLRDDSGFIAPILLDLDRDGSLDLVSDAQGGWAGPSDGFLAIDADGSGAIDQTNEIAFTEWDENARTDLEGLALAFDSNSDGRFDAQDERFAEFSIWRDADGDRVSQAGEIKSLEEAGITSIDLGGVPYDGEPAAIQEKAGNQVFGATTVAYDDGSFGIAGDVALTGSGMASATDGDGYDLADDMMAGQEVTPDAGAVEGDALDQLTVQMTALTSTVDQLASAIAAMPAHDGCSWHHGDRMDHPTPALLAA